MKYFRREINDFQRSGAYIKPDPAKVAKFTERLAPYRAEHRLVGICWRSGKLDPVRNLGYSALADLAELFQTPNLRFVNLQYGDCEHELRLAEERFGIEILRWPDLNLKDHLEDVLALIASLDCVASVQTAVLVMSGTLGVPVVGFKAGGWTSLGEDPQTPWFQPYRSAHSVPDLIQALSNVCSQKIAPDLEMTLYPRDFESSTNAILPRKQNDEISGVVDQILIGYKSLDRRGSDLMVGMKKLFKTFYQIEPKAAKEYLENLEAIFKEELDTGSDFFWRSLCIEAARSGQLESFSKSYSKLMAEVHLPANAEAVAEIAWLSFVNGGDRKSVV
jgi:hypothetical protein